MRASKRAKLVSGGWKVGDTKEFLDLSPEEAALIELRLKLAEGLKARRVRKRLTQTELAEAVQSSQSRVAKMESGHSLLWALRGATSPESSRQSSSRQPNARDQRRRAVGAPLAERNLWEPLGLVASGVTTSAERCIA
jgi:predicted XRE-type DNA-binding protein